jgi:sulfate permease, SulP family
MPSVTSTRPLLHRLVGPWVTQVSRATLRADLLAGLLGAVLVLPQGIAFATLAGLPPQYGLYTAVIPCAVAALFGSSWHVMSGPTNANSLALFAMLTPLALAGSADYIQLALVITVLVGVMQLLIGALRLGSLANFISPSVLLGFTSGAATLIAIHALKDLLGFESEAPHGTGAILTYTVSHLNEVHVGAVGVGLITLGVALGLRHLAPRWPFMLLGLMAGTLMAWLLSRTDTGWEVSLLGPIPSPWPPFTVPHVEWRQLPELLGLAFALTIVAIGQSISIAKAVAYRSGQHIDANREFVGQGLSNIVGGFFSSYVSCGSLNRSLPNLEAGARTPLAALFAAALLVILVAVSASLLALIPMAAIAGLLVLVAWTLLDVHRWRLLARLNRVECGTAAATFVATVTIRLEIAILLGTILSLVTYLYRTSRPAMRTMGFDTTAKERRFVVVEDTPDALPQCPQLKLLRMEGSVYFGATSHVADRLHALRSAPNAPKHLLVMAKSMNFIDLAGAELWHGELQQRRAMGGDLYFHRPRPQVVQMWQRNDFIAAMGADHVFPDKKTAIATIFGRLDRTVCEHCTIRVFHECKRLGAT